MAKRRTKKQKKRAKHPFLREKSKRKKELAKKSSKAKNIHPVKRQSKKSASAKSSAGTKAKKPMNKADYENLRLIKRHLVKSLSLAALILSLEIVIYLIRQG
jgi:hypothetical protein